MSCREVRVALTIAGVDSCGGAGIAADLKTFAALGVHGAVAVTAVTVQNTYSVKCVYPLPAKAVYEQIEAVVEDTGIDAAKTGMLWSSEIVEAVADAVKRFGFPLVIDPVIEAKCGVRLISEDGVNALIKHLIPLAKVVTPNRFEAERIVGFRISSIEDAKKAAKYIVEELGAEAAVVKGGHIESGESVDVLYWRGTFKEFRHARVGRRSTHGTGCVFSAAIAAELAKGKPIDEAVEVAKKVVTAAIEYGFEIGKGYGPVNPIAALEIDAERWRVVKDVEEALNILVAHGEKVSRYVPEVQMNICMSLPRRYCRSVKDVAAVLGRVVRYGNTIKPVGPVTFGASSHMARAVIAAMSHDPRVRAAANLRYDPALVQAAKSLGLKVVYVDRRREPQEVKAREGASIPWIIAEGVREAGGSVPDIIYDLGDWGKEPMIRVFGRSATEVAKKIVAIVRKAEELRRTTKQP